MSASNNKTAEERIASAAGAVGKVYATAAPESDGQEAIAFAIAALAESNLAVATAILESRY